MTRRTVPAGATLFYGSGVPRPDLALILQLVLDDLRAARMAIDSIRLTGNGLRLRFGRLELALSLSDTPLPMTALRHLCRPAPPPGHGVDLRAARVRAALGTHRRALGLLMRWRGGGDPADRDPMRLSHLLRDVIATISRVAPPALVLWQSSALALTCQEFLRRRSQDLEHPGAVMALGLDPAPRRLSRPGHGASPDLAARSGHTLPDTAPGPATRLELRPGQSAGRLFAPSHLTDASPGAMLLPNCAINEHRLASALRAAGTTQPATTRKAMQLGRIAALAVLIVLTLPVLPL